MFTLRHNKFNHKEVSMLVNSSVLPAARKNEFEGLLWRFDQAKRQASGSAVKNEVRIDPYASALELGFFVSSCHPREKMAMREALGEVILNFIHSWQKFQNSNSHFWTFVNALSFLLVFPYSFLIPPSPLKTLHLTVALVNLTALAYQIVKYCINRAQSKELVAAFHHDLPVALLKKFASEVQQPSGLPATHP